jgi:predicted O-methyltransferase YrrM
MKKIYNLIVRKTGIRFTRDYPRPSTKEAMKVFGNNLITAIEIGTDRGFNAQDILKRLNIQKIYLIDPYESYEGYGRTKSQVSISEKIAKKILYGSKNKIIWIKDYSDNAVKRIKEKVDFIYIDGNHEYEYVKKDIENYWPLVKKGGILAGHYINFEGVAKAVCEFVRIKKGIYFVADKKDWWIVKK